MVSSPTVSTPTLTEPTSQADTRSNTLSTTATTPQSIKSAAVRDQSPDAMHAAPIVRLRSAISPTSALFKANSFVPLVAEQGPIGPGLLKPAKRSVSNTKKTVEKETPKSQPDIVATATPENVTVTNSSGDFTERQDPVIDTGDVEHHQAVQVHASATPAVSDAVRPSTPPLPNTTLEQSNIDAWADADFSFFESANPVVVQQSQPKPDPSDPFSVFETRERSTSAASSAKTFTRSPPRKIPTPPVQPLTSATSSAQRRKTEEDGIIQDILRALPDLNYMLLR
jgi:hypothetical protein